MDIFHIWLNFMYNLKMQYSGGYFQVWLNFTYVKGKTNIMVYNLMCDYIFVYT